MPSGKNAWLTFLTFDLLVLDALLAVSMPSVVVLWSLYCSARNFARYLTCWLVKGHKIKQCIIKTTPFDYCDSD